MSPEHTPAPGPVHQVLDWLPLAIVHDQAFQVTGLVLTILISFIGIRMCFYWWSFVFHSGRYRRRMPVSTAQLQALARPIPNLKVQWTTKGTLGSTEVILRAIRQLEEVAAEAPQFYQRFLFVEVVTENAEQAALIRDVFADSPLNRPWCVVTPADYQTPDGTQLKALQMHYLVELRRRGWQRKPGQTFIVHFDEDTLMRPDEFRKLIWALAHTDKQILTGPIYYPLEYGDATRLSRTTEASRPITCWECRRVMEDGLPLHVHGSNIVVDEELENRVGWDIGTCDGMPYVAEDYVFGMNVFLQEGSGVFGWHGCVALEQPPFSFKTVFKQRFRWIFGVEQGMSVDVKLPDFAKLPFRTRMKIKWGTRYRIATFALGTVVGALSLLYMPAALIVALSEIKAGDAVGVSPLLTAWFALIGFMWLGANITGAWINVMHAGLSRGKMLTEVAWAVVVSPVAGMLENMSGLKAVAKWVAGRWIPSLRYFNWQPTPSTKAADNVFNGRVAAVARPLAETVTEAPMPWRGPVQRGHVLSLLIAGALATTVIAVYVGLPLFCTGQYIVGPNPVLGPAAVSAGIIVVVMTAMVAIVARTARPGKIRGRVSAPEPAPVLSPAQARQVHEADTQVLLAIPAQHPDGELAGPHPVDPHETAYTGREVRLLMREMTGSPSPNGDRP